VRKSLFGCLIVSLLFLGACAAEPFSRFYFDKTGGMDMATVPDVVVSQENPKLVPGTNPQEDELRMLEEGFRIVGYSSFNSGNTVDINQARAKAKKVHASVVLVYATYTGTISGAPWGEWSNPYGDAGGGQFNKVNRFEYLAMYWIKLKPPIFGAQVKDLSPEMRRLIGSNKGVLVTAVIKNSPAFRAEIFKGDVLKRMNDVDLYNDQGLYEAVAHGAGKMVTVELLRNGIELKKEIQLDQKQ
jgi:hypothetical protein